MRQNEDIRAEMQEIQLKLQKKLADCCNFYNFVQTKRL